MASIRKKNKDTYEVYGYKNRKRFSKTFKTKAEAKKYQAFMELSDDDQVASVTFCDLIDIYIRQVTSQKKSARSETLRLNRLKRTPLGQLTLGAITREVIGNYAENRMREKNKTTGNAISPATVIRELSVLSDIFNFT